MPSGCSRSWQGWQKLQQKKGERESLSGICLLLGFSLVSPSKMVHRQRSVQTWGSPPSPAVSPRCCYHRTRLLRMQQRLLQVSLSLLSLLSCCLLTTASVMEQCSGVGQQLPQGAGHQAAWAAVRALSSLLSCSQSRSIPPACIRASCRPGGTHGLVQHIPVPLLLAAGFYVTSQQKEIFGFWWVCMACSNRRQLLAPWSGSGAEPAQHRAGLGRLEFHFLPFFFPI